MARNKGIRFGVPVLTSNPGSTQAGDVWYNSTDQRLAFRDNSVDRYLTTEGYVDTTVNAHINDTTDAHDASAISYAGGTGMSATDVEAAIDELATEKADLARDVAAVASSTTAVGTSITALTGLSLSIPAAGTWKLSGWIPVVIVGSPTGWTTTLSPSGAPTVSAMRVLVRRMDNVGVWADYYLTAFNVATASNSMSAITFTFEIQGTIVSSTSGTFSVSMTRTGGTSGTSQIGAYIRAERLA